jgi:hypothetical protein
VRIRTVLDARPGSAPRFQLQTLALAHSWAAREKPLPLEVFVIGRAQQAVEERLEELGVRLVTVGPHPLDAISKTANKLVALTGRDGDPVLLVDNDVFVLDDLPSPPNEEISATVATRPQVTPEQWEHVRHLLGLEPLERDWVPLHAELKARKLGRPPKAERRLYLSTAVVWIRDPAALEPLWASDIERIASAFDEHPLSTHRVNGCDQAGFAVAAAQRTVEILPAVYNYRPVCFRLGLSDPKILHFGELGSLKGGMLPFSELLTAWWDRRILVPIRRSGQDGQAWPSDEERARLLDEAAAVRDRVLALGHDAGLDEFDFSASA